MNPLRPLLLQQNQITTIAYVIEVRGSISSLSDLGRYGMALEVCVKAATGAPDDLGDWTLARSLGVHKN